MLVAVCLAPAPSLAQLVIDPTTAVFNPSPDHYAVAGDTPIVSSYQLELYLVGIRLPSRRSIWASLVSIQTASSVSTSPQS